nr:hypothetical protein GCM10023233_31730 [Brevibacterium otitidis]
MTVAAVPGNAVQVNEYFTHHPDHVLGRFAASGTSVKVIADSNEPHVRLPQVLAGALREGKGAV